MKTVRFACSLPFYVLGIAFCIVGLPFNAVTWLTLRSAYLACVLGDDVGDSDPEVAPHIKAIIKS
jgi:hypothetical protein